MTTRLACLLAFIAAFYVVWTSFSSPASLAADAPDTNLFRRDNLMAWCIVPFDSQRRGPEARAEMLAKLGFKHFAYDYRAEHVPTFEAEILALKKHGVSLDAWWFPSSLNAEARQILDLCKKHDIHPQLWVTGGGGPTANAEEQTRRVDQEAARIRPIAEAAAAQGIKVGLYNHGGWFGEPENQVAIIEQLKNAKIDNVGVVYNLHHGHDHLDRLPALLKLLGPHLLVFNLNGMDPRGDKVGRKVIPLGQGEKDLEALKAIAASGYRGPIGILGHTQDDAEARLRDNLDGLDWLLPQLEGKPAGERPKPRTPVPAKRAEGATAPAAATAGHLAAGRAAYTTLPFTLELRATLRGKQGYNILTACEPKSSAAHWELFTMPGSGHLTAYLPGAKPDHVRSAVDVADGRPHDLALVCEPARVRLYVDGKLVGEQAMERADLAPAAKPAGLAFGRLVEGGIGCDGTLEFARLSRGAQEIAPRDDKATIKIPAVQDATLGLWVFAGDAEAKDLSPSANPAKRAASAPVAAKGGQPVPPEGVHLKPVDPAWKATLIHRSPADVYLGVKVDSAGRAFVGGRDAVFVFEPNAQGGYERHELLRFPAHSIIMGLEFRGDDLYVLAANALYRVPGGRTARTGLKPERILWGLPLDLHVSFHCLAWGPDGDLYVSHGDPLLNYGDWSRPDHWGHWTLYAGVKNEPFAYTGQGAVLAIKPDGTSPRVVCTGLRGPVGLCFNPAGSLFTNDNDHESRADQYAPARLLHVLPGIDFAWPRGWLASKSPDRRDLVDNLSDDLGRGVPCDQVWYDDPHFPSLRNKLLLCRWDRHSITAHTLTPRGISFSASETTIVTGEHNARPVGVAVGRGGRLFVTCTYMTGNMASPECVTDLVLIARADDPPQRPFESIEIHQAPEAKLRADLAAEGWELRGRAQQELFRRGLLEPKRAAAPQPSFEKALTDAQSDDSYRRQLGVRALAQTASLAQLEPLLARGAPEATRLAGVLAVGHKLTVPDPGYVPPANLPLFFPAENPFFKRNLTFVGHEQPVDLASLRRVGSFTIAQWWKHVERTSQATRLFELLLSALEDESEPVRLQAAWYLTLINDPQSEARIAQTRRVALLGRIHRGATTRADGAWLLGPFDAGETLTPAPEQGLVDLSAAYVSARGKLVWREAAAGSSGELPLNAAPAGSASFYASVRVESGSRQMALLRLSTEGKALAWLNGAAAERTDAGAGAAWLVDLQPGSNDVLVRFEAAANVALSVQAAGRVDVRLAEKLDGAVLLERLKSAASGVGEQVGADFLALDWPTEAARGDAAEGRRLFGTLACARCHAVTADQKGGGAPSLFEARRRFTVPHLVESILLPSRQVAEPFRGTTLTTASGQSLTGLVVAESAASLELLLPDASRRTVAKSEIEDRAAAKLSPMPHGLVKTPAELRNLLAYLLSERPTPP